MCYENMAVVLERFGRKRLAISVERRYLLGGGEAGRRESGWPDMKSDA